MAPAGDVRSAETIAVVEPTNAKNNKTLNFAAAELSRYLEAMTGRAYPVARAADGGAAAAARLAVDPHLASEEYRIRRDGAGVEIAGGSPRGCLYGAYGFLHALGCRWPLPGKENEVVPRRERIDWSGPEIRTRPAIGHRGLMLVSDAFDQDTLELIDYLAKNGYNFITIHGGAMPADFLPRLDEAVRLRDFGIEWGGHLLPGYLPRQEFAAHPDWFRMEKGRRTDKLNMCPSSDGAADEISRNALVDWERLRSLPRVELLHLWPDDLMGGGWCDCPKCAGLSPSDQSLKIINAVAQRLPLGETAIAHLSYHATLPAPTKVKPGPNVRLFFAPRERCYRHAMGECEANRRYLAYLKSQVAMFPNQPEVMEYYQDMVLFRQMPLPLHPVIGRDVEVYRAAGIDRITSLSFQRFGDWAYGVNTYVLGRAMWRGKDSPDDMREFCRAAYGSAAETMQRYHDRLFELGATAMETCGYKGFADLRYPLDEPFNAVHSAELAPLVARPRLDEIEALVADALQTAEGPYRRRVDEQAMLWKVARLETQAMHGTMLCIERMKQFRGGKMDEPQRRETIAMVRQIIADINAAGDILLAAPPALRGPLVAPKTGIVGEDRLQGYVDGPKKWLAELRRADEKPQ